MSFSLSLITSTGYPFYYKKISDEPANTDLVMRFFSYVSETLQKLEKPDQAFELQAGLVSALFEFAKLLDHPIELLRFKTAPKENTLGWEEDHENRKILVPVDVPANSDVLITTRTEIFLNADNYEAKINLIYNNVLKKHLPLGPEKRITDADENFILRLMKDLDARERITKHKQLLDEKCAVLMNDYKSYGLQGLIIASFDANPLETYGFNLEQSRQLLREVGIIPRVKDCQWVFRTTRLEKQERGLFIINSGCGITLENVFMPFYYILVTSEAAFLGDSPTTIYQMLNAILVD